MLTLKINSKHTWDPIKEEFGYTEGFFVELEHCLLAISKWESITNKPFLDNSKKTEEELALYIKCMSIKKDLSDEQVLAICYDQESITKIKNYIDSPMTATVIKQRKNINNSGEYMSSELMYYWLVSLNIPFVVETWPLQRMIKLVEVCSIKNQKPEKMSESDILRQNRSLNAARRAKKPKIPRKR